MLCRAERLLDGPELFVAKHGEQRVEIGVGTEHEDAIELGILLSLRAIDRKVVIAYRLEEASVSDADRRAHQPVRGMVQRRHAAARGTGVAGETLSFLKAFHQGGLAPPVV